MCIDGCTSSCSSVVGCRGSDSSVSYTATPAPAVGAEHYDDWNGKDAENPDALKSAAQSVIQRLSDLGDFKDGGGGTSSPPPTSTKPPPPTGTDHEAAVLMIIYVEDQLFDGDNTNFQREWDVMTAAGGKGGDLDDLCHVEKAFRKTDDLTLNGAKFPPDLGPFKAQNIDCQYKGDKKSLGVLPCDGYNDTPCNEQHDDKIYNCGVLGGPPSYKRFVHCIIYNNS